jgi:hypothetical protein
MTSGSPALIQRDNPLSKCANCAGAALHEFAVEDADTI